jgi:hypothetical protein
MRAGQSLASKDSLQHTGSMDFIHRPLVQYIPHHFGLVLSGGAVDCFEHSVGFWCDLGAEVNQWQAHLDSLRSFGGSRIEVGPNQMKVIRAQVAARDGAVRSALNGQAVRSGNAAVLSFPLTNRAFAYAKRCRQGGL